MGLRSFINTSEASAKLGGTIIKIDGAPAYVFSVDATNTVNWARLADKTSVIYGMGTEEFKRTGGKRNKFNPDLMDLNPLPLGFINYIKPFKKITHAIVALRFPVRQTKVGLNHHNVMFGEPNQNFSILFSKNAEDTMMGVFPSFDEAVDRAGKTGMCAFSRNFAVTNSGLYFIHMERQVGSHMGGRVSLDKEFLYLQEQLAEDLND